MQNMYTECTECEKALSKEDMEINKSYENLYYTICSECVERYSQRVLDIMTEE